MWIWWIHRFDAANTQRTMVSPIVHQVEGCNYLFRFVKPIKTILIGRGANTWIQPQLLWSLPIPIVPSLPPQARAPILGFTRGQAH